jgi:hypothetical protein
MHLNSKNKSNQLFPDYQMIKRENPSQIDFERVFSSEIKSFVEIISESFELLKSEKATRPPHYRNRNWCADTLNSNIQGKLIEKFGRQVKWADGRFFLRLNGKSLFFKKLDNRTKMPSHIKTRNSNKLVNNYATLFEEANPIIWIGYCVNDTWSDLIGIYAVSIDENSINWITDLSNFYDALSVDEQTVSIEQELPVRKSLVRIKRRIAKAE